MVPPNQRIAPGDDAAPEAPGQGRAPVAGWLTVLVFVGGGCASHLDAPKATAALRVGFGQGTHLIYVPGIGGMRDKERDWVNGLRSAGFDGTIETWDWTVGLDSLGALWASGRQRAAARQIAARVSEIGAKSPPVPVVLVGYSAGAGVAVYALQELPPRAEVDELVLLAPALSRSYDLSAALSRVRGRAHVFTSERDMLVLALGTVLVGTVDGVHGEAAGHGGFVRPRRGDTVAYAKLRTHRYSRARRASGDDGGHEGVLAPHVAESLVAPLLPGFPSLIDSRADAGG